MVFKIDAHLFFSYTRFFLINKQKINNQTEILQNLHELLNNLSASEELYSAGFIILIIK